MKLNSILESIESLPLSSQVHLARILNKRIIKKKRIIIQINAESAIKDYKQGKLFEEKAEDLISRLTGVNL